MLGFAHLGMIIGFIVMGALGMAALQDGLSVLWRHLPRRPKLQRHRLPTAKTLPTRAQRV